MNVNHTIDLKPKSKLPTVMEEFTQTKELCFELLKTKHYSSLGEAGVFAIVTTANSLGLNPIKALNGDLYYVQGKVEMRSILMAQVIRAKGHSFTQDKGSNDTICILHGRRKDNGDTWKTSFSIDDAKRAGIYKQGGPWAKYPEDMCYNRALSKLARKLFPDVIGSCYIQGEISDAPPLYDSIPENTVETTKIEELSHQENTAPDFFAAEEETSVVDPLNYLKELLEGFGEERLANFQSYVTKKFKVETLDELDNSDCLWLINKIEESERKAQ